MEIILSPHSGFCFGVKTAIEMAETAAQKVLNENMKGADIKIYSYGPLIHNSRVTKKLKEMGITVIDSFDSVKPGDEIIIRSHGAGSEVYHEIKENGGRIVDATCPYVSKIHRYVQKAYREQKQVVIVGDSKHPEVQGINGWCKYSAVIIKDTSELSSHILEKLRGGRVFIVVQTTMKKETLDEIISVLKKNNIEYELKNTICNATEMRQEACKNTAEAVDILFVIGDRASSNTKKLYEIGKKYCPKAIFIDNINNLSLKECQKYNRIGIAAGASTPEDAIKEVITNMSEFFTKGESMADFMEEIEKSLRIPRPGELVTGIVHRITDDYVIVNLGVKKDGIIPREEISLEPGQVISDVLTEGEEIEVKVLKADGNEGAILLSRKKLAISENWKELMQAFEEKTTIEVEVVKAVNGGVIAAYKEIQGFIPMSQLSDRYVEDASDFTGKTLEVKASRIDPRRSKAIFSRKAQLAEERKQLLEEIWESINVGDIVEGTVMRFTDYGAFVDIGGIDGLLHISEISWGKLKHPKEVLELGQTIQVKILAMNSEKGKISLGLKQTTPEPWSIIDEEFSVGETVKGTVVQIKEYGCFVEIKPGLDGLVHISEICNHRVEKVSDELSVGDEVEAKILEIDKERKRISLSIKETLDPLEGIVKVSDEDTGEAKDMESVEETFTESSEEVTEESEGKEPETQPNEISEEDGVEKTEETAEEKDEE